MSSPASLSEAEFRSKLQETFDRIESAFEDVDPDVAECDQQFGALTLRLRGGSRIILSAQPSVRQLWLALAAKGTAVHFNWDAAGSRWIDDKGKGIEVLSFLREHLREAVGLNPAF
jgi:CyaY protein